MTDGHTGKPAVVPVAHLEAAGLLSVASVARSEARMLEELAGSDKAPLLDHMADELEARARELHPRLSAVASLRERPDR